jgi:hypothetical protein
MRPTLDYAQRRAPALVRYGSLPRWVFVLNAVSVAVTVAMFTMTMSVGGFGRFFLGLADCCVFLAQFMLVALPSLGTVIHAERIEPAERWIALTMICLGVGGTALSAWFGFNSSWGC